ncbi:hypothetical protein [Micromonospora maris]|uniref:hypothetical protein n=1 Tax=Micromonospora maris TaxID=1003110 RepID=UPI002E15E259|nr:hypothetical protein OG712_20205 [Micromonospora maris]
MDVEQIVGSFVVEIGVRQTWPFVGLCDNRSAPAQETRLYIDASWTIEATTSTSGGVENDIRWLTTAAALNDTTIDTAWIDEDGGLHLTTDSGLALAVSGEPEPYTTGEPWRLSGWRPV